jgi:hypothetical protein
VLFGYQMFCSCGARKLVRSSWSINIWSRWDRRLTRLKMLTGLLRELSSQNIRCKTHKLEPSDTIQVAAG